MLNSVYSYKKRTLFACLFFVLMIVASHISPICAFEGEGNSKAPSLSSNLPINAKSVQEFYDVTGQLDSKYDDRVVINDGNFNLGSYFITSEIEEGDYVGAKLNDQGEVVKLKKFQPPQSPK